MICNKRYVVYRFYQCLDHVWCVERLQLTVTVYNGKLVSWTLTVFLWCSTTGDNCCWGNGTMASWATYRHHQRCTRQTLYLFRQWFSPDFLRPPGHLVTDGSWGLSCSKVRIWNKWPDPCTTMRTDSDTAHAAWFPWVYISGWYDCISSGLVIDHLIGATHAWFSCRRWLIQRHLFS